MAVVSLGALFVSAACSFSTDGITFVPDDEFDAVAGGTSRSGSAGKGSGGKGSAGAGSGGTSAEAGSDSAGEAGEVESGGTAGLGVGGKAGLGGGGKGGSLNTAGSGVGGMIVGTAGNLHSAGAPGAGSGGQGPMPTVFPCAGDTLADKLIADFTGITQPGREWKAGVKGDTLFSIARRQRMTVARIKAVNALKTNQVHVGQQLVIYAARPVRHAHRRHHRHIQRVSSR